MGPGDITDDLFSVGINSGNGDGSSKDCTGSVGTAGEGPGVTRNGEAEGAVDEIAKGVVTDISSCLEAFVSKEGGSSGATGDLCRLLAVNDAAKEGGDNEGEDGDSEENFDNGETFVCRHKEFKYFSTS